MKKISSLKITAAILAFAGLLGFGHLMANPTLFEGFDQWISSEPMAAISFLFHWLISPVLMILAAAVALVPQIKLSERLKLWILLAAAAVAVIFWFVRSSFGNFWSNLFDNYDYIHMTVSPLASVAAVSHLVPVVVIVYLVAKLAGFKGFTFKKSGFSAFLANLFDAKLENFISRKVSGVLYAITAWLLVVAGVFLELGLFAQLLQGNLLAFLGMLLTPVALLLILIVVRMAFEAGIALIVIAENTKK